MAFTVMRICVCVFLVPFLILYLRCRYIVIADESGDCGSELLINTLLPRYTKFNPEAPQSQVYVRFFPVVGVK